MPSSEESQIDGLPGLADMKGSEAHAENTVLVMSEEQALACARASPSEALPIHLTFSSDDKDNPRNFSKWRKWYITFVVSFLNVLTYVQFSSYPIQ